MIRSLMKKKKAFTLVEVIIVLAIIAIIAAIAIPNLTKVRTTSKIKADTQSCETIKRTVVSLITEDTIKVDTTSVVGGEGTDKDNKKGITFEFTFTDGKVDGISGLTEANIAPASGKDVQYVVDFFKDIKAPQEDGKVNYEVKILADGEVTVETIVAKVNS